MAEEKHSFGDRSVPAAEHTALVRGVFERVARRYDLMNDLMSGGLHRLWKAALVDRLRPRRFTRLVDLAGGTGDVAMRVLARLGGEAEAVLCDLNTEMLRRARDRALDRGLVRGLRLVCADAAALPLPAMSADYVTVAFGIRNVTRRADALGEAHRVLRPGGHFLCLEFSPAVLPALAPVYDAYSFSVLPALGRAVVGDAEPYRYLAQSIRRFPAPEAFADELRAAGFGNVGHQTLSGGIVALHSGWRV